MEHQHVHIGENVIKSNKEKKCKECGYIFPSDDGLPTLIKEVLSKIETCSNCNIKALKETETDSDYYCKKCNKIEFDCVCKTKVIKERQ